MDMNELLNMTVSEAAGVALTQGMPLSSLIAQSLLGTTEQLGNRQPQRAG